MARNNNRHRTNVPSLPNPASISPIQETILRSLGQPTKYTPEACVKILQIAAQGGHVSAMILAAGANSRTTFHNWQKEYPEFKEAAELAKIVSQAFYEDPAVIRSMPPTAWALLMSNKFSDDYNKAANAATTTNTINFNTLNLDADQKMDRIKGLLEKLNSAGKAVGEVYDVNPDE